MPSSAARLFASAAAVPDCQVFIVSTSSHQTSSAGTTSTPAVRAAGSRKPWMSTEARVWP
jgi:hypothetical protein